MCLMNEVASDRSSPANFNFCLCCNVDCRDYNNTEKTPKIKQPPLNKHLKKVGRKTPTEQGSWRDNHLL